MNNTHEIKLMNENGVEKTYGQIPDLYHLADFAGKHFGENAREQILQVWMMAHDLKSVAEEQRGNGNHKAHITEVLGLNQNQRGQLDAIVTDLTAFHSFFDLVDAQGDYRPTINIDDGRLRILADAYDKFQENRGDDRRAYRYHGGDI
jgi:hypothetical protein